MSVPEKACMEASEALSMVVITLINPWYQLGCE